MIDIFSRQRGLISPKSKNFAVVGCGGVGSWVALFLGMAVPDCHLYLFDHDVVEDSNLARTPFKLSHIGQKKVVALAELLAERRLSCTITPYAEKVEDLSEYSLPPDTVVIDCRDIMTPAIPSIITGGYDGNSVTLHQRPDTSKIWGDAVGYTSPSWLAPPVFIAVMIVTALCLDIELKEDVAVTKNIKEVFDDYFKA
ncbi:MAG: ThiF family adenylyltransferase [Candidatus Syntropharchaeales archaeon]